MEVEDGARSSLARREQGSMPEERVQVVDVGDRRAELARRRGDVLGRLPPAEHRSGGTHAAGVVRVAHERGVRHPRAP